MRFYNELKTVTFVFKRTQYFLSVFFYNFLFRPNNKSFSDALLLLPTSLLLLLFLVD